MNEVEEKLINRRRVRYYCWRETNRRASGQEAEQLQRTCAERFVGAFLPSMGGQYIMLDYFGGPLIVTSANSSGMPIIRTEEEMFDFMDNQPLVSEAFYNLREIRVTVDDSVVRVIDGQPQMIRRSKGYVPVPLYMEGAEGQILAVGGQLKNSLSLSKGPFAYVSQYFGDMDTVEAQEIYNHNVERMSGLFRITPEKVVENAASFIRQNLLKHTRRSTAFR